MLFRSLQFTRGHENAMLLAPFARRAINRLSWKRNRSIKVKRSKRMTARGIRRIEYMGTIDQINVDGGAAFYDTDPDWTVWGSD